MKTYNKKIRIGLPDFQGKVTLGVIVGTLVLTLFLVTCSLFFQADKVLVGFASPTDVTIMEDTTWTSDMEVTGTLTIQTGVALTIDSSVQGVAVTVAATNLVVEEGALISASGKGFSGGAGGAAGEGVGRGKPGNQDAGAGGAGYGGAGGAGDNNAGSGGIRYGSSLDPVDFGSGGGGVVDGATGGAGGGAVRFVVPGKLTVIGDIAVDGADGVAGAGGGAGGSILIDTGVLDGSGNITADGGDDGFSRHSDTERSEVEESGLGYVDGAGGAGGGGRIYVKTAVRTYDGVISANGGSGATRGGAGTVVIEFTPTEEEKRNLKKRYKIMFGKDETEIGDFETMEFRPHAKIKRWGEESSLSVEFPDNKIKREKKSVTRNAGKIDWDSPEIGSSFYKKSREEVDSTFVINESGGVEFEVVFKEIPDSNVVSLPIETEGLVFYYQGPLSKEEIAQGAARPEEVVGSYAVYHESKQGGNYKAGKAFHVYRPKIIDANGDWVWGVLKIEHSVVSGEVGVDSTRKVKKGGVLRRRAPQDDGGIAPQDDGGIAPQDDEGVATQDDEGVAAQDDEGAVSQDEGQKRGSGTITITIDRKWLDNAAYPVIVDPTFGYDTQGASSISLENVIKGAAFTEGASGETVSSITAYLGNDDAGAAHAAKYALYNSNLSLNNGTGDAVSIPASTSGWYTSEFSSLVSLSASTEYVLAAWGDNANTKIYYDTTGVADQGKSDAETYGTWPDPLVPATNTNKYSMYTSKTSDTFVITFTLAGETAAFDITATLDSVLPTVSSVVLDPVSPVPAETETDFTITFSEDMDTATAPTIKYGISDPYTTATIVAKTGEGYTNGYQDAEPTFWEGTTTLLSSVAGECHISITGAKDSCGNTMEDDVSNTFDVNLPGDGHILIRDAAGGEGSEITTDSLIANHDTLTLYAVAYTSGDAYLNNATVTWGVTGTLTEGDLSTTSASSVTFEPALNNTGVGTITAAHAIATDDATGDITVTTDSASKLGFTVPTGAMDAIASAPFNPQPTVEVQDQYGNIITGDSTSQITLSATAGAATALQPSEVLTEQVSSGTVSFSGIY
ncbi:MAG: hypothetical protein ISS33_02820, partial [Candidatus Omnitrophica bacterium]|nr:hypothetical protein [Candidatus Omnitrophota bacterium]